MRLVLAVVLVMGCGPAVLDGDGGVGDSGGTGPDGSVSDDGGPGTADGGRDAGPGKPDAGQDGGHGPTDAGADAGPGLVTISGERELRGVWVATVSNLDWPTTTGLSADAGRASLDKLVGKLADAGFNALYFQVRPESDALYESALEPWSRFLTGTQGKNPGWDPLATVLELAHARGIEVHAWFNPYRALFSAGSPVADTHVTKLFPADAITYNSQVVMDPGSPVVRQHVLAVIKDVLDRYDVDGVHFDDYFYPYPDSATPPTPFPDTARYQDYQADAGTLAKADWRRSNVNTLVAEVMQLVTSKHPQVRFGIAPFGIWKSGVPAGVSGLSSYDAIYCDSVTWMNEGWVDYLAPQIYWATTDTGHTYTQLATWWAMGAVGGRHVYPGHATYKVGAPTSWGTTEYRLQVTTTRSLRGSNALGDVHFRAGNVTGSVFDLLANDLYAKPALVPPLPRANASIAPSPPALRLTGGTLVATQADARFLALYAERSAGQYELRQVLGGPEATFQASAGAWVVTAVARGGAESQGLRIVVP